MNKILTGGERLLSKKNKVVRHGDIIYKTFSDRSRFQMEKEIGDLLENSGLLTPARLSVDEPGLTIKYENIKGPYAVDLIENIELSQTWEIFGKICNWLAGFYTLTLREKGCQWILGDIHLRNFIYECASGQIYGFDFEECRHGRIESDAARLCVFILHYDPAFTERKKTLAAFVRENLTSSLGLDEPFLQSEVERETKELLIRRAGKP